MRIRRSVKLVSALFAVILLIGAIWWLVAGPQHWAVSPFALRRARSYLYTSPGFFKYCAVTQGSRAALIVRRFGSPTISGEVKSPQIRDYVAARTRAGWSEPNLKGERVLVYEVVRGIDMIVAYYCFTDGRLIYAFVSET